MPRIEPTLPADCAAYVSEIQATVQFRPQSTSGAVFNFLGKLPNVVWLHLSNTCNNLKIAQLFAQEMGNMHKDEQELSYELSFLSEATIAELRVPYSIRNLDIVNMAILTTKLVHKQVLLIGLAKALKAQAPIGVDVGQIIDVIDHGVDTDGTDGPGEVEGPAKEKNVADIVKGMATPSQRHLNNSSNMPSLTTDKLVASDFWTYLEVEAPGMPFINHVKALANLIDHASLTKKEKKEKVTIEEKVQNFLGKLYLMHLLFLFETVTVHRDVVKRVLIDSYLHTVATSGVSANRLQAIFKQYLVSNQRDEAINGRYVELIEDISRAERAAARGVALVAV